VEIFEAWPLSLPISVFILGLLVGSFLNVVAHRLPIMMQRAWREQCEELMREAAEVPGPSSEPGFNLSRPRSACPACGRTIAARHNVPILSYLWLKGRCAYCGVAISVRYPLLEAFTALASMAVALRFGASWETVVALPFTWTLIAMATIDIDHQLLPDSLTLPLLWAGLAISILPGTGHALFADLHASVLGAMAGYLCLWTVYQLFRLMTGKEGMGYGDFKLLAALGAWMGWQALPLIIIASAGVGAVVGGLSLALSGRSRATPIPFGPFLAAAGWIALLWGPELTGLYLRWAF
jgi:leader peptidase (prepilin peptidase)/N-methyltransferase